MGSFVHVFSEAEANPDCPFNKPTRVTVFFIPKQGNLEQVLVAHACFVA